ncbi:MAM and LDL-receptor class A domain-containing protein 1-like isoform X4 [Mytilus edulis]|uniref:MAM and LDL-receptor class A domain-containing protein 1-like isoform X4 n=1 Tax=Mytilus edulis TaxID=6550 RepID=UPI0039EFE5A9
MKITLFCVLVFWTICSTTSREIPQQYSRNARIAKELNELEHLLKEREHETHNPSDVEGEKTMQEPDEEREMEVRQGRYGKRHLDRPSKSYARKMEDGMQKLTHRKGLLAERKMKEWRKSNGELPEPENIDPDDPESNLLEGMEIENNGHPHLVQGLHPENSAKTYGDSHDSHKLTPEQEALAKKSGDSSGRKRNFDTYTPWLWKDGIVPYSMLNMSSSAVTVINKAIKQVNDYTCVKWVTTSDSRFNPTVLGHSNVITFINGGGCWSYVGNVNPFRNNVQPVSLSEPGCISVSTSVHEMLHAMGGHHEQSRSDRDGYVSIAWPNVRPSWNGQAYVQNINMAKSNTQDNNPYDAESSMQYSLYAFSNNGQKTILFKDQRLEFLANSADGLEFYDIQDVTDAYKCTDHCTNKPNCQNGGFVNFQCTCTCPDVLTGAICEQTVSNSQTCGGVINLAAGEERLIQSPNYPSNYPTGLECTWLIKGPANSLVRASLQYMDITSGSACSHWLEYRYNLLGQKGPKVCGTNFVADVEKWDSSPDELSNAMIIRFDSNTYSSAAVSKGFSIKVSSIGTGCLNEPCVLGTCNSPLNSGTYTCTCNPGVTGTNCDQLTPSYQLICTFEFGEKCLFENEGSNVINWDTNSQGTPSSNTGPNNAHGGFQYVYTEMSRKNPGDKATMSTTLQLPTTSRCMMFYYHMKGSTMGTLNIYSEGTNTAKSNIWTRSGAQGDDWIKAEIDIPAINGLKVTIEGVRGSGWSSDIAIDDVSLIPGTCGNTVTSGPTTAIPVTAAPTTASPTTAAPTTAAPTTAAPTTAAITTSQPTGNTVTSGPTTAGPTTAIPVTAAPTTASPTTAAPTTAAPTTAAPTTAAITTSQPTDGTQTCTFEDGAPCFLVEATNDDFDWTLRSGSTPSGGTGPQSAVEGSKYKYVEVSSPRGSNDVARLESSTNLNAGDYCLTFQYHMFGLDTMGDLKILTGVTAPENEVFIESGNLGDQWNKGMVTIHNSVGMKLFIEANKVTSWKGDIAIDDIQLMPGACAGGNPVTSGPTTTGPTTAAPVTAAPTTSTAAPTTAAPTDGTQTCTFEDGAPCFLVEATNDDFDWTLKSGSTPSGGTGPQSAVEGSKYKYVEVSSPIGSNDVARLESSLNLNAGDYCLTFQYHMFGLDTMGDLKISTGVTAPENEVFIESGNLGDQWNKGMVTISNAAGMKLFIEANKVTSWKGDIAIDDIQLMPGACAGGNPVTSGPTTAGSTTAPPVTAAPTTPSPTTSTAAPNTTQPTTAAPTTASPTTSQPTDGTQTCTFEDGASCFLVEATNDDFDWTLRSGSTPSRGTGPQSAVEGSKYKYVEVSSPRGSNDVARLESSTNLNAGDYCLTFQYHMFGLDTMGDLKISTGVTAPENEVFIESGNLGNRWNKEMVTISNAAGMKLFIEANKVTSWKGDIAIDDIQLMPGACAGGNPVTSGPTTTAPTTAAPVTAAPTTSTAAPTTAAPTTTNPTTATPTTASPTTSQPTDGTQTCTFEDGAPCFLVEATNDDFDWTLRSGSTPTGGTGPQSAVEGSKYKYVEVSSPIGSNDVARLESSINLNAGDYCLTFQYHMFGLDTMGDLKISTGVTAPENEVFIESGNLGDQWNKGMVTISNAAGMKLFIEANKVTSWKGDIAIDDIQLIPGACAGVSPCDYSPCQNGGSCSETTTAIGYTCSCLGGFVGQNCNQVDGRTVSEFTCDFETENNCVFENADDDDFQWTYRSGSTPSGGTGPSSAYEGTQYVYTEASSPRDQGDKAVLSTVNTLLAGTSSYCLQFYLHMYGTPGTMEVKFGNRGSSSSSAWSQSDDQGNQWVFHQVELPPSFADPVIFFEAIRGSSYKGDVALDLVKLSLGQCASGPSSCATNPCNNSGSCNEDGSSAGYYCNCMTGWSGDNCDVQDVSGNSYSCGFETDGATCIFKDTTNDEFDWTRRTKSTPSSSTGPSGAATGDYYMYIETSSPRVNGDTAVLSTQDTNLPAGSWCLTFQYHMKGSSMGSLEVFAGDRSSSLSSIWTKSGEQSDPDLWKTATIDIPQQSNPVITIDGIRGSSYRGDIAIDDIALNAGTCASAGK